MLCEEHLAVGKIVRIVCTVVHFWGYALTVQNTEGFSEIPTMRPRGEQTWNIWIERIFTTERSGDYFHASAVATGEVDVPPPKNVFSPFATTLFEI